jgi:uroporphyrinogen decarboxylase
MIRNMKDWLFKISSSPQRYAMPIMTYPGLNLVNKGIMDVIKDGSAQFECIDALSKKYTSLAAVTIMDLSVEAEAFGSPVTYSQHDVPTVS